MGNPFDRSHGDALVGHEDTKFDWSELPMQVEDLKSDAHPPLEERPFLNGGTEASWGEIQARLRSLVNDQAYMTWIQPIRCQAILSERISLLVPNEFFKTWIQDCFLDLISQATAQVMGRILLVDLGIDETLAPENEISVKEAATALSHKTQESLTSVPQSNLVSVSDGLGSQRAERSHQITGSPLNPKYVFHNFIVGASNQIAHAAAQRVSESPGNSYNPLFIYSQAGLGKTHLLHAIGNQIKALNPELIVHYISAEKFVNELVDSLRSGKMAQFRAKYRDNIDVLMIDDIQFIAKKERTQEEFFHTFNYLYNAKKQIVFTSDKLPKEIDGLEDRLRTRFEWGLMADIQPPEVETRIAILKHKAQNDDIYLPDDVLLLIANNIKNNIRELEGCLVRLGAYASITNMEINLEMAKEVLKDVLNEDSVSELSLDSILKTVASFYRVKVGEVKGKSRLKEVTLPRQVSMFLSRNLTQKSFKEIGGFFGGRDHSTVMHAVDKIQNEIERDAKLRREVNEIESIL